MLAIPIIGQPTVTNWFVTVQVICSCKTPILLVGQIGARSVCANPECGKIFSLKGLPTMDEAGHISVPLGISSRASVQ